MPWKIENEQKDEMTLMLDDGGTASLPGEGEVSVNDGVKKIQYHKLTYERVGAWVFKEGITLKASYPGGQNIELMSPDWSKMIFAHKGP